LDAWGVNVVSEALVVEPTSEYRALSVSSRKLHMAVPTSAPPPAATTLVAITIFTSATFVLMSAAPLPRVAAAAGAVLEAVVTVEVPTVAVAEPAPAPEGTPFARLPRAPSPITGASW
jgi:hypothetical protein